MPRHMRREFAGAIYHVINCGDRREEILRVEQIAPFARPYYMTCREAKSWSGEVRSKRTGLTSIAHEGKSISAQKGASSPRKGPCPP